MGSFFLNPWMLWGALLFTVPLIIHLLSRRRYRRIPWAAMDFLLAAYKRTRRRVRLENLLLLIVRCLIPILFALAAARPYLSSESPLSALAEKASDAVLVCDVSYSMNRRTGAESCLDRARAQMRRLISSMDFESGDSATVMTMCEHPALLSSRLDGPEVHLQRIDSLTAASNEGADLLATLQYLRDDVVPRIPGAKNVFIFSDLQRRTFVPDLSAEAKEGDSGPAAVIRSLRNQGINFYLVDVSGRSAAIDNLVVDSLDVVERTPMANQAVTLVATVQNTGTVARRGTAGAFFIDGERGRSVTFDVDPGQTTTAEITHVFRHDGFHAIELRLEEDDLLTDDTRYLALPVRGRIPVLLVDGDWNPDDDWSSETGRLALMLDPLGDTATERGSPFAPRRIPDHRFNSGREKLSDYQLIVLANVAEISEEMGRELLSYVKAGGGLLVFLGDKVDPLSYDARLWHEDGSGLLPWRLLAATGTVGEDYTTMRLEDLEHPVLAPFAEGDLTRYLTAPPTFRFFVLDEPDAGESLGAGGPEADRPVGDQAGDKEPADGVQVLARWNDAPRGGSPAIISWRLGEGRAMLVTTTADSDWTLLPETKGFLPFLHEIAYYLTVENLTRYNVRVGSALRRSLTSIPRSVTVALPSGERRRVEKLPENRIEGRYPLDLTDIPTNEPGFYQLEAGLVDSGAAVEERLLSELFAANVDPREGQVAPAGPGELAAAYEGLFDATVADVSDLVRPAEEARRGEIFKALLAALIALVVVEMVLAYLFGRRQ